jgi:hypothetical protein
MIYADETTALRARAAELRQSSIDWLTSDHIKARRLLEIAEKLEERVVLLEAAGRVGAPATYQQFRRHFLRAGNL